jgi:hypothetical protein
VLSPPRLVWTRVDILVVRRAIEMKVYRLATLGTMLIVLIGHVHIVVFKVIVRSATFRAGRTVDDRR